MVSKITYYYKKVLTLPSSTALKGLLSVAMMLGLFAGLGCISDTDTKEAVLSEVPDTLPEHFQKSLSRFEFINRDTGKIVEQYRILGWASGTYVEGGPVFDTYIVGFEDRYEGAGADLDFIDVLVEMKQAQGTTAMTVRIVQLGLDTIDVYMDGELVDSVRPAIEIQIETPHGE